MAWDGNRQMNRKQLYFKLSRWLLARSGDAGRDSWFELQAENARLHKAYSDHEARRTGQLIELRNKLSMYQKLVERADLVDGLLSQKQYDEAQRILRVALIETRPLESRSLSQDNIAAQMAALSGQQNRNLGGLGNMLGGQQADDRFSRFFGLGKGDWP